LLLVGRHRAGAWRRYPAIPVGTTKRERQKANRQQRLEELAKQARKNKTRRRAIQITIVVGGGLLLLFGLGYLFSDDDDPASGALPTVPTATTLDPASTVATVPATTVDPASTTTEGPTTTVAREFAFGTAPCPEADGSTPMPDEFEGAPQLCIDPDKSYTAEVVTNKGAFTITLDPAGAPGNVNNFVTLARYGYYDGTGCHRVLAEFVVQCGRPGDDESAPGYSVPDELPAPDSYAEGMVVMANTGQPDSGGGQWFVITGLQGVALPPQYTVIGLVTEGFDTTVTALANLADPTAANGVPPLLPIDITSITVTES
jgi:cyclophilin family peptidyl-prolyl cis-trans isomerase